MTYSTKICDDFLYRGVKKKFLGHYGGTDLAEAWNEAGGLVREGSDEAISISLSEQADSKSILRRVCDSVGIHEYDACHLLTKDPLIEDVHYL